MELLNCTTKNTQPFGLFDLKAACRLVDAHDGDTVKVAVAILGVPAIVTCRLDGIDCPEIMPPKRMPGRAACVAAAIRSRNRVIHWMSGLELDPDKTYSDKTIARLLESCHKIVYVHFLKTDKYGRTLARFYGVERDLHHGEGCLSDHLVKEGLARPYDGGTKCAPPGGEVAAT